MKTNKSVNTTNDCSDKVDYGFVSGIGFIVGVGVLAVVAVVELVLVMLEGVL